MNSSNFAESPSATKSERYALSCCLLTSDRFPNPLERWSINCRDKPGVVAPRKNQCFWDYWLDALLSNLVLGQGFDTHLHGYICL